MNYNADLTRYRSIDLYDRVIPLKLFHLMGSNNLYFLVDYLSSCSRLLFFVGGFFPQILFSRKVLPSYRFTIWATPKFTFGNVELLNLSYYLTSTQVDFDK